MNEPKTTEHSPVYGPVRSWRFGQSLGVDPIGAISTCSFNCVYCQLGNIQRITAERGVFVEAERVAEGLAEVDWTAVDVVSISGSGEPTLATNLAEIVDTIKAASDSPLHILTNATFFEDPKVRADVAGIDVLSCKLDAADEATLHRMNRPAEGVTLDSIVRGILLLKEEFPGRIELQVMFMPMNQNEVGSLADLVNRISPSAVQLNTPRRPYPLEWHIETRGAHDRNEFDWPTRTLSTISGEKAEEIEAELRRRTDAEIISVYH